MMTRILSRLRWPSPIAIRVLTFIVATAIAIVVLSIVASIVAPDREFLPGAWHAILLQLERSAEGSWVVVSSDIVPEDADYSTPESCVSILVRASCMGRWQPGKLHAWRTRSWMIVALQGEGSAAVDDPESPLSRAVQAHIETTLIPGSSLWELWPRGHASSVRHAPFRDNRVPHWIASSSAFAFPFRGLAPAVLVGGIYIGAVAATFVRVRRAAPAPPQGSS